MRSRRTRQPERASTNNAGGTIVSAGYAGGYGNRIVVNHGFVNGVGLATSYSHMSGYAVQGGRVERGQVIGYEGTTGASTGCHLHFEVFVNGATVDPMGWLRSQGLDP